MDALWVTEAQQIPILKSTLENNAEFFEIPTNSWVIEAKDIIDTKSYIQSINYVVSGFNEDMQNAFLLAFVDGYTVEEALKTVENNFIERNVER